MIPADAAVDTNLGVPGFIDGRKYNKPLVSGTREVAADFVITSADDFIEATGGAGAGIIGDLPPCVGLGGTRCRHFKVQKVDSGAGPVTVTGTINGDSGGYILSNPYQYVEVKVRADESGYLVVDNN